VRSNKQLAPVHHAVSPLVQASLADIERRRGQQCLLWFSKNNPLHAALHESDFGPQADHFRTAATSSAIGGFADMATVPGHLS
jgi:hypothetical protein